MSAPSPRHRQFVYWASASSLAALLSVALFNYLVDPYGIFGSRSIKGFNAIKPAAAKHVRQAKPYMVSVLIPHGIIGGSSRPEMGLDPQSACWADEEKPIFNIALPGSSVFMQARMLQHSTAGNRYRGKQVFWGLDFMDFLGIHSANEEWTKWPKRSEKFEKRLLVTAYGQPNRHQTWTKLKDMASTLFSLDTIRDSAYTLFSQNNKRASHRGKDGFNPARDYLDIIALEGQKVLFLQKNQEVAQSLSRHTRSIFGPGKNWSYEFETVSRMLDYMKQRNTNVILFINPYHVDYLSLIELSGRWKEFEQWKYYLQQLAERKGVVLWDFSLLNEYTTEQLPSKSQKGTLLQWFWEPAHYKSKYGDLMLQQILGRSCTPLGIRSIGVRLTRKNTRTHLADQRRRITEYVKHNPKVISRLRSYLTPYSPVLDQTFNEHGSPVSVSEK
jgi:hypothetical protein